MLKGFIFDIKRFAVHDGPGIRTSVFLKGCPCSCWWCHNPESIKPYPQKITKTIFLDGKTFKKEEIIGSLMSVFDVMTEIRKDKIFYDESGGGVTFSGGEPLMQSEFLLELLKECKNENIHTTVDTSGFVNEGKLLEIIDCVDLFLYDLKLINNELHKKYTGVSNKMILQNIQILVNRHKQIIIRIPIIPGITDTNENLEKIIEFLRDFPAIKEINLLPYHNIAAEKYKRLIMEHHSFPKVKQEKLDRVKNMFEHAGYKVKIGG